MSDIKGQTASDLVNRDMVIKTICECECYSGDNPCKEGKSCYAVRMIRAIPTIDAVPRDFHDKTCEAMAKSHLEELEKYRWIPCSERLPKINHNVLLSTTNGEVFVGYRDKPDLIWQVTEKGKKHWVYDPEAYTDDIDSLPKGEDCGFSRYTGNDYSANGMLSVTSPNYDKRWDSVNAWMPLPKPYKETDHE